MRLIVLLLFSFCTGVAYAQIVEVAESQPQFAWSVGLEVGGQTGDVFATTSGADFRGRLVGLNFFVATKLPQFSFGTGLHLTDFATLPESVYLNEFEVDRDGNVRYRHQRMSRQFEYLSVPLRIQYSLHCDCAFLQVGLHPGFLLDKENTGARFLTNEILPDEPYGSKSEMNLALELSAGFRLYFTQRIRLQLQPAFVRQLLPYYELFGDDFNYNFVRITFNLEYALFRE